MSETRKLAAILAADVAGYSRLTATDEERTVARLRGLRTDLIDPAISVHHGRVVKRTGDGILIEFRSVVDAVRCSIEVQNGMVDRNAGLPPERQIWFRAGIHVGDVIEESDGDLMGDGVNIASRLENICEPGAILLSEDAYRYVKSRLDLAVTDLGNKELKNIPEPVHVFLLAVGKPAEAKPATTPISVVAAPPPKRRSALIPLAGGIAALIVIAAVAAWYFLMRPGANIAANAPAHLSIVVLPFQNLSGDEKQDYLADVITDQLTTYIARSFGKDSLVIARNTAMTYKGKAVDVREIAKDLSVRYVLEGSVQPTSNRIRVNAQLIDAEGGSHLWADTFDTDKSDLLQVEDKIVTRLGRSLNLEVMYSEAARAERVHPSNPDAEDLALRCKAAFYKNQTLAFGKVGEPFLSLCEQALVIDPNNVDALTTLSWALAARVGGATSTDRKSDLMRATELVSRALQVDRNNSSAHTTKSFVLYVERRFDESREEAERAIALDPSDMNARYALCAGLYGKPRAESIIACVNELIRLSPHDPILWSALFLKGAAYVITGQYDTALEIFRQSVALKPDVPLTQAYLTAMDALLGQDAEAHDALARYLSMPDTHAKTIAALKKQTASDDPTYLAMRERLYEGLRKAGMPEDEGPRISVVVLPFANLSGDAKQDYLADALTDELTTALARIHDSFVIARNTAFTYKGKSVDAKVVGKELGVRYVLEGSVQPSGNQVRVNAQLIDADRGTHVWADQFDTARADLLQTQDEIVVRLARALEVQLSEAEAARLKRTPAANPDAEDLALQCAAGVQKVGYAGKGAEAAYRLCEQALAIDPDNVRALSWLAVKSIGSAARSLSADPKGDIERADQLVSQALALDPNDARAHELKGFILATQGRVDESVVENERALALDPSLVVAYSGLGISYLRMGQFEKSIEYLDKALRLSPRDPNLAGFFGPRAADYFGLKQYDQAIESARRSISVNPNYPLPYFDLIAPLALGGHVAEAREAFQRYLASDPKWPKTIAASKKFYAPFLLPMSTSPGYLDIDDRYIDGLRKAGMPEG